jgi:serine/threonine protein phosphatase PrpC
MAVTCPSCGGTSQDWEFCDHCNSELQPSAASQVPPICPVTGQRNVPLSSQQAATLTHPEASVVLEADNRYWRVHWLDRKEWLTWKAQVEQRQTFQCKVLLPIRIIEDSGGAWVIAEALGAPARPWEDKGAGDVLEPLRRLLRFLRQFAAGLDALHAAGLAWLNFDPMAMEGYPTPPAIEGAHDGAGLCFTNLDLRVFPVGADSGQLHFCPAFAAPEVSRFQAGDQGPRTDVFHLAIFAYSWLAGLLPVGIRGKGLESFAFALPPLRVYAPSLPPNVAQVLARGLEIEPQKRYPSPSALCEALEEAVRSAERRWSFAQAITWEVGAHTCAGRTKTALGLTNEDSVLVRQFESPARALLAVADGISICDLGNGGRAGWLTCLVLDNSFGSESRASRFPEDIVTACRRASADLLSWALGKGHRQALRGGARLMGTTLTAAWLEGNELQLGNVGDSRAYLITAHNVEQLTVDGDVACTMLALGMPPEEVRELGRMGKALHGCIGCVTVDDDGEPRIQAPACTPRLSRWPLLPGDVVVLCSDGLVDEGAALEPTELGDLVRRNAAMPAEQLAQCLAEAADARQQRPSAVEPDGFGDNISCIVVKVASA